MNYLEIQLKALTECLSEQKIKYVILGGIAVSLYGEPRLTADIDVNVILEKEKLGEFLRNARRYGFYPVFTNELEIIEETGVIPLKFIRGKIKGKTDIIIAENILEYNAIKRGRIKKISSIQVRLVSPEDLIIHKLTSTRPRDFEDLRGILWRQKGKLDIKYIRYWLKKIDETDKKVRLYKLFNQLLKVGG
ncbi:MAG: nucleotidyltransferase [Candidatus Omnitrophica bacterium]|nr:nucleotidyltransferase [Candidatus Omnitrophota bacterium]